VLAVGALSAHLLAIAWTRGFLRNKIPTVSYAPFFSLLCLWFVGVFVQRMKQQRELQREIDELNEVERLSKS
jgi:hypothetical protein